MKTKTEQILAVMNVLAWLAFIGLAIQAGAIMVSYGVSTVNPEGAKNLYKGLNLYNVRQFNFWHYTVMVAFMVGLCVLKAYIAYLVIKILSKIKLASPFTVEVSAMMERISYYIFSLWLTAMVYDAYLTWLAKQLTGLEGNFVSGEFIFLAGLVFVIAQIFKKGVEIQSENELTV
jgi:hypothetical protein